MKSKYLLKRLNRFSSSVASFNGSALSVRMSCVEVMVSMTSFTATSCDLGTLHGVFVFFCKVYILPFLPRKHSY